jgi:hypothetical protein
MRRPFPAGVWPITATDGEIDERRAAIQTVYGYAVTVRVLLLFGRTVRQDDA